MPVVAGVGIAAWLLLVLGLVLWPPLLGWGLAGFGAEYALYLRLRGGSVDARAPAVAAVLLLVAELSFLSAGGGLAGADRALIVRLAGAVAAAVAGVALLADLLLVASGSAAAGNLLWEAGGVAAAALSVGFVVRLARRSSGSTST